MMFWTDPVNVNHGQRYMFYLCTLCGIEWQKQVPQYGRRYVSMLRASCPCCCSEVYSHGYTSHFIWPSSYEKGPK
jgi:hypothetical protein